MQAADALLPLLKQTFGYDAFRPNQREIIADVLAGRDVFALLPTGGGKSLCYQLPALKGEGLTLVISPLIALMKDQVDGLHAAGIEATFLNSTLTSEESQERLAGLNQGRYRLLYAAPERVMMSGFLAGLKRWNVRLLAIDEAHCVSEWGHDFRPEYRELPSLRTILPDLPILALTATATHRVREDIMRNLALKDPAVHVGSFNRPNLTYRVLPKSGASSQLLDWIRKQKGGSGIVYCQSRKTVESVATFLQANKVPARPYHAGLESVERVRNQELFLRDEIQVICATIAFGMGINKPNVRFVAHYDLPKNIEGYYQETGRAGRDGLPSECLLLFSGGDMIKYRRFIDEKPEEERENALQQLNDMAHFAESPTCRRRTLLAYFGETWTTEPCGGCDNCLHPPETFDATIPAQQFLSCVLRIHRHGGFGVGMAHVIDVILGGSTEKVRRWKHETLSTYGVGRDRGRTEWQSIARQLLGLGLLRQQPPHQILELTPEGQAFLKQRAPLHLARTVSMGREAESSAKNQERGAIECDEALFERLRQLRRRLADERDVPAYVIFSDVSLRHMARQYPTTLMEFSQVNGVGEQKLAEFGKLFSTEIEKHVEAEGKKSFAPLESSPAARKNISMVVPSTLDTVTLFLELKSIPEVAARRNLAASTIAHHLAQAVETQQAALDPRDFYTLAEESRMEKAFGEAGFEILSPVKQLVGESISYEQLKLYRAFHHARQSDQTGER